MQRTLGTAVAVAHAAATAEATASMRRRAAGTARSIPSSAVAATVSWARVLSLTAAALPGPRRHRPLITSSSCVWPPKCCCHRRRRRRRRHHHRCCPRHPQPSRHLCDSSFSQATRLPPCRGRSRGPRRHRASAACAAQRDVLWRRHSHTRSPRSLDAGAPQRCCLGCPPQQQVIQAAASAYRRR